MGPLSGETTWSLMYRLAARYGQEPSCLLSHWRWKNHQPRHPGGALRADAEVLLSPVGQAVLARLAMSTRRRSGMRCRPGTATRTDAPHRKR